MSIKSPPHHPVCHRNRALALTACGVSLDPLHPRREPRGLVRGCEQTRRPRPCPALSSPPPTTASTRRSPPCGPSTRNRATITATRTFTFPSEYLSAPGYMCEYMQCYSPDFSRMIIANDDGENEKVAVVSTNGTITVLNDAIPTPSGHTPVSNHFAQFGPTEPSTWPTSTRTPHRIASVQSTVSPQKLKRPRPFPPTSRSKTTRDSKSCPTCPSIAPKPRCGSPTRPASDVSARTPSPPTARASRSTKGTIYSKPGTPLAQTTPEDQTLLVSNWTKVSLPSLESTHTIEGWLAVSPDGTQMALYASPKDPYSDLSLHLFVAPVTGGEATQITTTTEDVPGVVQHPGLDSVEDARPGPRRAPHRASGPGLVPCIRPRSGSTAPAVFLATSVFVA